MQTQRMSRIARSAAQVSPVLATVLAVLLIILGVLVIVYPSLLAWIFGIGFILLGVAILAMLFAPQP